MNRIYITDSQDLQADDSTLLLSYKEANRLLPLLRSDHFRSVTLANASQLQPRDLKFLVQLTRLLKPDGEVLLDSPDNLPLNTLLKTLHLFEAEGTGKRFLKSKPEAKEERREQKLAIGFHASQLQQQIDENELLEGEDIEIGKKKEENCDTKPRACANCNCGRKDVQTTVSKQELIKAVNEGNPVSGCGKCFLGDSFRCGTCPYKGLPAFKPGDKLKLEQNGGVQVQSAATFVSASGKVKLQL